MSLLEMDQETVGYGILRLEQQELITLHTLSLKLLKDAFDSDIDHRPEQDQTILLMKLVESIEKSGLVNTYGVEE